MMIILTKSSTWAKRPFLRDWWSIFIVWWPAPLHFFLFQMPIFMFDPIQTFINHCFFSKCQFHCIFVYFCVFAKIKRFWITRSKKYFVSPELRRRLISGFRLLQSQSAPSQAKTNQPPAQMSQSQSFQILHFYCGWMYLIWHRSLTASKHGLTKNMFRSVFAHSEKARRHISLKNLIQFF